jgi:hypothetical protein
MVRQDGEVDLLIVTSLLTLLSLLHLLMLLSPLSLRSLCLRSLCLLLHRLLRHVRIHVLWQPAILRGYDLLLHNRRLWWLHLLLLRRRRGSIGREILKEAGERGTRQQHPRQIRKTGVFFEQRPVLDAKIVVLGHFRGDFAFELLDVFC